MKTIDEIRQQVEGNKSFWGDGQVPLPHNMMSGDAYEIAVTLLAEVDRLNTIANKLLDDLEYSGYSYDVNIYREELKGNQNG